jgi:AcrR family transcriptional regulator
MVSSTPANASSTAKRVRLSRDERHRQLLGVAWRLAREEGTDALTLPRMANESGVTKPVIYDHFGTRNGLLTALYQDFDERQTALIDAAIAASVPTLEGLARVIALSYVECVLAQGREIPGILAGLAGSPELEAVKREYQLVFIEKCRKVLAPFLGTAGVEPAGFWGMLGAADGLSHAAACGEITVQQAQDELYENIMAMVGRSGR